MVNGQLPKDAWELVLNSLPTGAEWMPLAGVGIIAGVGLVVLLKGARLAPGLTSLVFALVAGTAAGKLAPMFSLPVWPVAIIAGAIGVALALSLFRVWFAILVGLCFAGTSLGFYASQTLVDPINKYLAQGLDPKTGKVSLPNTATAINPEAAVQEHLANLWTTLQKDHPSLNVNLSVIAAATCIGGFVFALLLPKAARSIVAASVGTAIFMPAAFGLLQAFWKPGADAIAPHLAIITAAVWGLSLLANMLDVREKRAKKSAETDSEETATA